MNQSLQLFDVPIPFIIRESLHTKRGAIAVQERTGKYKHRKVVIKLNIYLVLTGDLVMEKTITVRN